MKTLVTCLALLAAMRLDAGAERLLVRVEAEDWAAQGGGAVKILSNPDASGGKTVSYWEDHGVWLEVPLEVQQRGSYLLSVGYALGWPQTTRNVFLNGQPVGEIVLGGTGAWTSFATATTDLPPLALEPGRHLLRFLNADSVGLSLDWVALHTREVFFGDRTLSADEKQALLARWKPAAGAPADRTLVLGRVRVQFDGTGRPAVARVGEVAMAAPGLPDSRLVPLVVHQTGNFRLAALQGHVQQLWITDGRNLYLVALQGADEPLTLPAPVLAGDRRVASARTPEATLNLSAADWEPRTVLRLEAGGLHLTCSSALRVGPWSPEGLPDLRLEARQPAAAKWSFRWGSDEPAVAAEHAPGRVVIRDCARRFPTLAAFYGEKPFEVRISGESVEFVDENNGETLRIR